MREMIKYDHARYFIHSFHQGSSRRATLVTANEGLGIDWIAAGRRADFGG